MNAKDRLKTIVHERLDKTASAIFINKALGIIDESADSKESFLAAADKISKRTALFIDADLAKKLFGILKAEIGNISSPSGTRRRYARVLVSNRVYVTYNGKSRELYASDLSEGGVYVKTKEPLPVGVEVEIILPLETVGDTPIKGVVIHRRPSDETPERPPGMGIAFKEIKDDVQKALRNFIDRTLSQETY